MLLNMFAPLVLHSLTFNPTMNNITTSTCGEKHHMYFSQCPGCQGDEVHVSWLLYQGSQATLIDLLLSLKTP